MDQFECLEVESIDSESVVKIRDKRVSDPVRVEQLGKELESIAASEAKDLKIDFDNVKFLSSAALSKLVVFEKRLRARGGTLRLSNLRPEVRDVFNLTRLDSVFHIED